MPYGTRIYGTEPYFGGGFTPTPLLVSATTNADGTEIRLTFSEVMEDPTGEHGSFSFEEDATGRSFTAAALAAGDATTIVLTVDGAAIEPYKVLTASYDATTGSVQSAVGVALESFTDQPVTNVVCDADFCTTFQEYAVGAGLPTGWENQWDTSRTFAVEDATSSPGGGGHGGKLLRQTSNGTEAANQWVRWMDVPVGRHTVRSRVWLDDNTGLAAARRKAGLAIFGSGDSASKSGFVATASVQSNGNRGYRIEHLLDGALVSSAEAHPNVWAANAWNWMELLFNEALSQIELRFWADTGSRPSAPTATLAVAEPLPPGGMGIHTDTGGSGTGIRWDVVEVDADPAPAAPVLEGSAPGTTAFLATSEFVAGSGSPDHHSSEWQIRPKGATDWEPATLVGYLLSEIYLTAAAIEDQPAETVVEARARHIGTDGVDQLESEWSQVIEFTTSTESPRPDTPTLSVEETGLDFGRTLKSAFAHAEGTMDPPTGEEEEGGDGEDGEEDEDLPWHLASEYEIRDRGTLATVLLTGLLPTLTDPEQVWNEIGDPGDELEIRVRDQDGKYGTTSEWSAWVPFDLLTLDAFRPNKPTITVDTCSPELIEVTGSAYVSGDDPASPHAETRWWIGSGPSTATTWRSALTTDPAKLTSYEWIHPFQGKFWLAVSYKDETGRWSERSDAVECDLGVPPPQPFITAPTCSGLVEEDLLIEWEITGYGGTVEYEGELGGPLPASGEVASWTSLFVDRATANWTLDISGLADGEYVFRVRACDTVSLRCGEWHYLPVTIDRTGAATLSVPYDFASLSSFPGTWDIGWDSDKARWSLVNSRLENQAPYVGILAENTGFNEYVNSVLRFNELGEPTDFDAQIIFAFLPRDAMYWGWRYAYTHVLHGGVAWRVLNLDEVPAGKNRQGIMSLGRPGGSTWGFPDRGCHSPESTCPCGFVHDEICRGSPVATAWAQQAQTHRLIRYATSGGRASVGDFGYRQGASTPYFGGSAASPYLGELQRGASMSRQLSDDPCNHSACEWLFKWYTLRYRVRRVSSTQNRFRLQLLGPGLDASQGWTYDRTRKTKELGLLRDDEVDCGPCGLAFRHFQNLTLDHGILFRCARFTIYDEVVAGGGPVLGTASLVL